MNQDQLTSEIIALERKVQLLLGAYENLQKEAESLREENQSLKNLVNEKDKEINNFHNSIKISKIASQVVNDKADSTELKRKINEYIKEIDKCIAHLSR